MKMSKMFLVAVTFVLLSGPLSAHASIIYNWTGDCQRILFGADTLCTKATVHVVTTDAYVPGTASSLPLLDWTYSDDISGTGNLALLFNIGEGTEYTLPALAPGESRPGESLISLIPAFFQSHTDGTWRFENEGASPNCDPLHNPFCGYGVVGINGVWTRVSEPSSLVLLGVGLAGLLLSRRRRRLS